MVFTTGNKSVRGYALCGYEESGEKAMRPGLLVGPQGRANARFAEFGDDAHKEIVQRTKLLSFLNTVPLEELQRVVAELVESCSQPTQLAYVTCTDRLSARETQVLVLVANGYSRAEISHTLDISPNTAARHIANIYRKLDISNVAEATTYAIAAGLVAIREPNTKAN